MIKMTNKYRALPNTKDEDLSIDFSVDNEGSKVSFSNEKKGVINIWKKEDYSLLNKALRSILAKESLNEEIEIDGRKIRIKSAGTSKNHFVLEVFFDNEAFIYEVDYLSFIGNPDISIDVVGFLEESTVKEIKKISEVFRQVDSTIPMTSVLFTEPSL